MIAMACSPCTALISAEGKLSLATNCYVIYTLNLRFMIAKACSPCTTFISAEGKLNLTTNRYVVVHLKLTFHDLQGLLPLRHTHLCRKKSSLN